MTLLDLNKLELSTICEIISHEIEQENFKSELIKNLLAKFEEAEHDEQIIAGICSKCGGSIFHGESWEFSSVGALSHHHVNC